MSSVLRIVRCFEAHHVKVGDDVDSQRILVAILSNLSSLAMLLYNIIDSLIQKLLDIIVLCCDQKLQTYA